MSRGFRGTRWLLMWLWLAGTAGLQAQSDAPANAAQGTSDSATQSDLAGAAQRARDAREKQRAKRTANSDAVNEMAQDLEEESEQAPAAPVGYRYYSFKPGDYWILVPADAEVEGRDGHGLKLLSSDAMGSRTLVILGDPIPNQGETPDDILNSAASGYLPGCKWRLHWSSQTISGHAVSPASVCSLNHQVLGSAEFIMGDGFVLPVVCGYPFTSEDLDPNPNRPINTIVKKYDRERNGYRACDVILPSVRFHQHGGVLPPQGKEPSRREAVVTKALLNGEAPQSPADASLAALARTHRKTSDKEALTDLKHVDPGFSAYSFSYCSKDECFDATLQIPTKARVDDQFRVAYTGLFEFLVPVEGGVAVIQATKGASTKPGIISREEFIRTKVDWGIENVPAVYFTGAGKGELLSEDLTTLADMPARRLTFRSPTAFHPVITKMTTYMAPGVFVHIRCSVPEKAYTEAQDMCEHVVDSLQVPKAAEEARQDDNDP